jgi:hypothetical protein
MNLTVTGAMSALMLVEWNISQLASACENAGFFFRTDFFLKGRYILVRIAYQKRVMVHSRQAIHDSSVFYARVKSPDVFMVSRVGAKLFLQKKREQRYVLFDRVVCDCIMICWAHKTFLWQQHVCFTNLITKSLTKAAHARFWPNP